MLTFIGIFPHEGDFVHPFAITERRCQRNPGGVEQCNIGWKRILERAHSLELVFQFDPRPAVYKSIQNKLIVLRLCPRS